MADNAPDTEDTGAPDAPPAKPEGWWQKTKSFVGLHGGAAVDDVKSTAKAGVQAAEIGAMMPGALMKMMVFFLSKILGGDMMKKFFTPAQLKVLGVDAKDFDDADKKSAVKPTPDTHVYTHLKQGPGNFDQPVVEKTSAAAHNKLAEEPKVTTPANAAPIVPVPPAAAPDLLAASTAAPVGDGSTVPDIHVNSPMDTRNLPKGGHRDAMPSKPFDTEVIPIEAKVVKPGNEKHHVDKKTGVDYVSRKDEYRTDANRHAKLKMVSVQAVNLKSGEVVGDQIKVNGTTMKETGIFADKDGKKPETQKQEVASARQPAARLLTP